MTKYALSLRGKLSYRAINAIAQSGCNNFSDVKKLAKSKVDLMRLPNVWGKTAEEIMNFVGESDADEDTPSKVCVNCVFFSPDDYGHLGACRRHSPVAGPRVGDDTEHNARWPRVAEFDFCGDFVLDPF